MNTSFNTCMNYYRLYYSLFADEEHMYHRYTHTHIKLKTWKDFAICCRDELRFIFIQNHLSGQQLRQWNRSKGVSCSVSLIFLLANWENPSRQIAALNQWIMECDGRGKLNLSFLKGDDIEVFCFWTFTHVNLYVAWILVNNPSILCLNKTRSSMNMSVIFQHIYKGSNHSTKFCVASTCVANKYAYGMMLLNAILYWF